MNSNMFTILHILIPLVIQFKLDYLHVNAKSLFLNFLLFNQNTINQNRYFCFSWHFKLNNCLQFIKHDVAIFAKISVSTN